MKHPKNKTKVVHSKSKPAWNVVGTELGKKFKIARVPYNDEGSEIVTTREKAEALKIAQFINYCFNNPDKVILP